MAGRSSTQNWLGPVALFPATGSFQTCQVVIGRRGTERCRRQNVPRVP